jgi:hypothetical protein
VKAYDPRIYVVADVFDEICALVTAEPALRQFLPAASMLAAIAGDIRAGSLVTVVVPADRSLTIPTRELAERLLALVHKAPAPVEDDDASFIRTMAILHTNLAHAVVFAIMEDYREIVAN